MSTKPMILIDGDILLYRVLSSNEKEVCLDPEGAREQWALSSNLADFKEGFSAYVRTIGREYDAKPVVIISDSENFRKAIYPPYKENRRNVRKAVGFKQAKDWIIVAHNAVVKPSLEADDVMGILATKPGNETSIVWTLDKDLRGIPCNLVGKPPEAKVTKVTLEEADHWWLTQTLTGDPVDNYPGCKGVGPVAAEKILGKPGDPWENVVQAFIKAKLTEEDALVQARVARILRWSDWDSDKQQPILWTPPNRPLRADDAQREVDSSSAPQQ